MFKRGVAVLLVAFMGCAGQQGVVVDGKTYGVTKGVFRGRWWSYYERGSSFLAGGLFDQAATDFQQAVRGRSTDTWQARTYGLHFVEYFPNRELGIAYYQMNRLDEARQYLEKSLEQVDTARANQYLDLVTRKQIASGQISDTADPSLQTSLKDGAIVSSRQVPFELSANDDVAVARIEVNGKAFPQRRSNAQITVADSLLLNEGTHEITFKADDLADKSAAATVKLEVDLTGPTIGIFSPRDFSVTKADSVRLEGVCVDKNGVALVTLADRPLSSETGNRVEFSTELPLQQGDNAFVIIAKDIAGNETRSVIKLFRGDRQSASARLWELNARAPYLLEFAQDAAPASLPAAPTTLPAAPPAEPIAIVLRSPRAERPYRHNKTLYVSGDATAQTKVAALTINGEPFNELTGAPKETFSRRIPIDAEGDAVVPVDVQAKDDQGHETVTSLKVNVRPVQLDSPESKLPLAVLAFVGEAVEPSLAELLRVGTEASLFEAGRFRVLDRIRLRDTLTELQLAAALADPDDAIALGRLTNAHVFLVADLFERGGGVEVKARAISTETSEILQVFDAYIDDKTSKARIDAGLEALAADLAKAFPRLSGEILSVRPRPDGDEMLLNWTREDGVREGMYLLVVEETDPWIDPVTGTEIEPGEMVAVARGRIQAMLTQGAKAKAFKPEQESVKLDAGMAAITM
ncbi:MAG TPA: hypothetical protein VMZ06_09005 [Candidatus Bathyarchaeia archaeon]|nr:hypothetical protein [Candidatus Bathyarchaeia archaeon]